MMKAENRFLQVLRDLPQAFKVVASGVLMWGATGSSRLAVDLQAVARHEFVSVGSADPTVTSKRKIDYDGNHILGICGGTDVCLWDSTSGRIVHRWAEHREQIYSLNLSPKGSFALTSSWCPPGITGYNPIDTRTCVWDVDSGKKVLNLSRQVEGTFSKDETMLLTFSERGDTARFDAAVWDVRTGNKICNIPLDKYATPDNHKIGFSPDGSQVASLGNRTLSIFSSVTGKKLFESYSDGVEFHFYAAKDCVATYNFKEYALWNIVNDAAPKRALTVPPLSNDVAWQLDGQALYGSLVDGTQIARVSAGTDKARVVLGGGYPLDRIIASPGNESFAVSWGGANGIPDETGLYNCKDCSEISKVSGVCVSYSDDGKSLLIQGPSFEIVDASTGNLIRSINLQGLSTS